MAKRDQAEEISRAADRITDSVQELTSTLNRFLEFQESSWRRFEEHQRQGDAPWASQSVVELRPPRRVLPEEEAVEIALAVEREVREEWTGPPDPDQEERTPAPSPDEVRERREERREREFPASP